MFSNFEKAFKKDEHKINNIPKEILTSLNKKLPEGFKYAQISKNTCVLTTDSEEMNIKLNIELPKDYKPQKIQDLIELIYRTQQELKVLSNKDSCIKINGREFQLDELIKFVLLDEKEIPKGNLIIKPAPFPDPFNLEIEADGIKENLLIQRQPYADMNKSLYESIDDKVLQISYIFNEKENEIKFSVSLNIEKAKNVAEIFQASKFYNAFLEGKIRIAGENFPTKSDNKPDKNFLKTLEFWGRAYSVSEQLGISFTPKFPITKWDAILIEKLYRSFVKHKPYKQYVDIKKGIISTPKHEIRREELLSRDDLSLHFIAEEELTLFEAKLQVYGAFVFFDLKVNDIVPIDQEPLKYEFKVEPIEGKKIYQSVHYFINKQEAEAYMNNILDNIDELKNAKPIELDGK